MDDEILKKYIDNEVENEYLDFKIKPYDWKKEEDRCDFLKDVLSFANSSSQNDRYIILGVKVKKDGERIYRGIKKEEMEDSAEYQQLISENIEPTISIETKIIHHNKKDYGIIRIFNCNNRPYLMRKKYCNLDTGFTKVRKGSRNNNLTRYLLDEIYEDKNSKLTSKFKIYGLNKGKLTSTASLKAFNFPDLVEEKEEIINLIDKINKFKTDDYKDEMLDISPKVDKDGLISIKSLFPPVKIEIDEKDINTILEFVNAFDIKLSDNFFDIGNATKRFDGINGNGIQMFTKYKNEGSLKSLKKLEMINELIERLNRAKAWLVFIDETKDIKYIELAIEEIGSIDDEDIEVNLELPKGMYVNSEDFPVPKNTIIEEVNMHFAEKMFKPYYTEKGISEFRRKLFPRTKSLSTNHLPLYNGEVEFLDIDDYIDYEIDELKDKTILKFTIKNIKENEKMIFPGNILIKGNLKKINYYIISKNSKKKVEGTINI